MKKLAVNSLFFFYDSFENDPGANDAKVFFVRQLYLSLCIDVAGHC